MANTPVPLPILNPQTLFVLACPNCDRFHCFRQLHGHQDDDVHHIEGRTFRGATHVLYNHPAEFGPIPSRPTCPALQDDDLAAVQSAGQSRRPDPLQYNRQRVSHRICNPATKEVTVL